MNIFPDFPELAFNMPESLFNMTRNSFNALFLI